MRWLLRAVGYLVLQVLITLVIWAVMMMAWWAIQDYMGWT